MKKPNRTGEPRDPGGWSRRLADGSALNGSIGRPGGCSGHSTVFRGSDSEDIHG